MNRRIINIFISMAMALFVIFVSSCLTVRSGVESISNSKVTTKLESEQNVINTSEISVSNQTMGQTYKINVIKYIKANQHTEYMLGIVENDISLGNFLEAYKILLALQENEQSTFKERIDTFLSQFQPSGTYYEKIKEQLLDANLFPVQHWNGKYGYIDKAGKMVIEPTFESADFFYEGVALVSKDDVKHFINRNGKIVLSEIHDYDNDWEIEFLGKFSDGLCRAKIKSYKDRWDGIGFINIQGEVVIPPDFNGIRKIPEDFSEGLAIAENDLGKKGFIDAKGEWIIKPQFADAKSFSEGMAAVQYERFGPWGFVSIKGQFYRPVLSSLTGVGDYHNGLVLGFHKEIEHYVFLDKQGKVVLDINNILDLENKELNINSSASSFSEGLSAIHYGSDRWQGIIIINTLGKIIYKIPPQSPLCRDCEKLVFVAVGKYNSGTIPVVAQYQGAGFLDYYGNFTLDPMLDEDFGDGIKFYLISSNAKNGIYYVEFPGNIKGYVDRWGGTIYKP